MELVTTSVASKSNWELGNGYWALDIDRYGYYALPETPCRDVPLERLYAFFTRCLLPNFYLGLTLSMVLILPSSPTVQTS